MPAAKKLAISEGAEGQAGPGWVVVVKGSLLRGMEIRESDIVPRAQRKLVACVGSCARMSVENPDTNNTIEHI